jgi:hypothetical protein
MELATTLHFTSAVRLLAREVRRLGLTVPGFRCPPKLVGVDRTLRRRGTGSAVVAVRLKGRPLPAVLADMIDGVLAANGLTGAAADSVRSQLWLAVDPIVSGQPGRQAA